MTHPIQTVLARLKSPKKVKDGVWQALCPAPDDNEPSLAISWKEDRVLLHCHAGCRTKDIVAPLQLKMSDLFVQNNTGPKPQPGEIVAEYKYTNESGELLFQVVRESPKAFKQRQPGDNGKWIWSTKGVKKVLYRLPKINQAVKAKGIVFVVEGEEDVHAIEKLGPTATTNPGGAGKWRNEYSETLRGARVVVLPDNDEAGSQHAQQVASSLYEIAEKVKVLKLPGLKKKEDPQDWVRKGGTRERLLELAGRAPDWKPPNLVTMAEEPPPLGALEEPPVAAGKKPTYFIESYPDFARRVSTLPEPKALVSELIYEDSSVLMHGQPRTMKTLCQMEIALALTTGTPAFGLERFSVNEKIPVLYVMEEDPERKMFQRFEAMLAGRSLKDRPELLYLSVRRMIDLDDPEWQEALIAGAKRIGAKYTIIDPFRAFTEGADGGPKDLRPYAQYMRRFMTDTGSTIGHVHHDSKPPVGKVDTRKRPQKASGGGIYSICDSPLHLEEVNPNRSVVVPCGYKFAEDPQPFLVKFDATFGNGKELASLRLVGEDVTEDEASGVVLTERILTYLSEHPGSNITKMRAALKVQREALTFRLDVMLEEGQVREEKGPRNSRCFFPV